MEDFSYSDKVISVYWKDERYTIAENLLADAKKRLKSMAVPQQSYTCGVMDLARARENQEGKNNNIYSFLEFELYQNVVLFGPQAESADYPHCCRNQTLSQISGKKMKLLCLLWLPVFKIP